MLFTIGLPFEVCAPLFTLLSFSLVETVCLPCSVANMTCILYSGGFIPSFRHFDFVKLKMITPYANLANAKQILVNLEAYCNCSQNPNSVLATFMFSFMSSKLF